MRRITLILLAALAVSGVASADPSAGSRQVVRVRVPDVRNMGPERAYALARSKGLRIAIPKAFDAASNVAAFVLEQSPKPGSRVRRGSVVTFKMGIGGLGSFGSTNPTRQGTVPAVVGLRVPEATRQIRAQFLHWRIRYSPLPPTRKARFHDNYTVTAQDPAPGTAWDDQQPPVKIQARS